MIIRSVFLIAFLSVYDILGCVSVSIVGVYLMYRDKKILGLIPARGGSVAVPEKNIYPLNGKPLISYTIDSAQKSMLLDALYCSTNDDKIAAVATSGTDCRVIRRPDALCTDTSKTIDCVLHALNELSAGGEHFDYVMILQPTSPLRRAEDIDACIRYVVDHNLIGCVSISEIPYLPVLMRHTEYTGGIEKLVSPIAGNGTCRRQDAKITYYVDGCLYLWAVSEILSKKGNLSLNDAPFGYKIDSKYAVDINTMADIRWCEYLLKEAE